MLHVKNVTKKYNETVAVKSISFTVNPGEIVGIIGPNGAGKSTTLKMVCGLLKADAGTIAIKGEDVSEGPAVRRFIGYVPEDSPIYEDMSVRDYLRFFGSLYDLKQKFIDVRGKDLLTSLSFEPLERPLGNLSKGMKRKVMIARSLLHDPDLLVYDEPASGLDPTTTHFIVEYIKQLKTMGKAIVISGHNLFQMEQLCDRIIFIKDGTVYFDGTAEEIKHKALKEHVHIEYTQAGTPGETTVSSTILDKTIKSLVKQGASIVAVNTVQGTLEEAFLKLIK